MDKNAANSEIYLQSRGTQKDPSRLYFPICPTGLAALIRS